MNDANFKNDDDMSALERARRKLYAPDQKAVDVHGELPVEQASDLPHAWEQEAPKPILMPRAHKHVRAATIFFISAATFFLVAGGVAAYLLYFGGNSVSTQNIQVSIQGPTSIAGGDTAPLLISITNRNPVELSNATLEVGFPPGTRSADNLLQEYPRYSEKLGTLEAGQTITRTVKAVIFGGQGESVTLPVSLSYGASGSSSVFVKRTNYVLGISSAPLSISVNTVSEAVSGKPFTIELTVRSNATTPLSNVSVNAAYPLGFTVSTTSVPMSGAYFVLGTLQPSATRTIRIVGSMPGTVNEKRTFHFTVGTAKGPSDPSLAVTYMSQQADVAIAAPFISTSLSINGDTSDSVILSAGSHNSATLSYANTLPTTITNATIEVTISGNAVDYGSVTTSNGFYRSADHTVVFSQDTSPALSSLSSGASGLGTFGFTLLPTGSGGITRSPSVTFSISVSGTRVGQSSVPEQVSASVTKTLKVSAALALKAAALHSSGPYANTGPIPPVANEPTTYTVQWTLSNPGNAVADAAVSTVLPSYVSFISNLSSANQGVTYLPATRTVTWTAGELGTGGSKTAAFQITLTPSTSQRGSAPFITGPSTVSGFDRFTQKQVQSSVDALTTETPGDPGYRLVNATVQ